MKPIINLVQSSPRNDNRSMLVTWGFDTIGIIYGASVVHVCVCGKNDVRNSIQSAFEW